MDVEALATLESQKNFCRQLVQQVIDNECFILLAGDSGSGRTVVCESVVNETDSKLRAVFIPSNKDMQIQKLRELFLQQLLPDVKFDPNLNLADALSNVRIPHNQKVLVVVDDIDVVVASFYNELLALHEQFLGQHRFAFVVVCHPLWAEEKASRYSGKADVEIMSIPPLQIKEAIILSRHIFALNNTMRIYRAISNKLPDALAAAKGNLSQVINITEKLMKEPTAPQASADKASSTKGKTAPSKKKSSSVGIFVTIVCIIIVLACLIPIFFGGNFFSDDDQNQTRAKLPNDNALAIHDESLGYKDSQMVNDEGLLPQKVPQGIDAKTPDKETEHSVTLSGKELDKIEGGANGSGYPRGVEGSVNNQVAQVVTLRRGDNFNHVNPSRVNSTAVDVPPQQQAPQQMPQQPYPQQQAQAPVAPQPEPRPMPQQRPQTPEQLAAQQQAQQARVDNNLEQQREQLEKAAQAKLAADRKVAEQGRKEAEAKAKKEAEALKAAAAQADKNKQAQHKAQQTAAAQQPARAPLRAGQVINLADEQRAAQAAAQRPAPQPVRATGNAVEAPISELNAADGNHFTVQIVSASNRANISAAASALNGKYWIVETRRNGKPWYVLVAGNYASREEAQAAARTIPASVSQGATPFAKRLSEVKADQAR